MDMLELTDEEITQFIERCAPTSITTTQLVLFLRRYEATMKLRYVQAVKELANPSY